MPSFLMYVVHAFVRYFADIDVDFLLNGVQRILAPFGGSPTALPEFPDDDTWYYYVSIQLNSCYFTDSKLW